MDELRKLIQIIEKRNGKPAQILSPKSKEKRLYEEIVAGKVADDRNAYAILYTQGEDVSGLKMVKSRLRKKLMNQLFFLDEKTKTHLDFDVVEQNCLAKFYQAKVLIDSGANDIALPLLKQILAKAIEYDFNYISSQCLRALLLSYVNLNERNLFYKSLKQLNEINFKTNLDQESDILFMEANIELNHSVSLRKNFVSKIDEVIDKIKQL